MNAIVQLDPARTTGKTRQLFDAIEVRLGVVPNPFGNASALEDVDAVATRWVEDHGDYLFNFAVGQVRDPHAAEDIVQDTLLAAFKSWKNFSGRSSERTWLVGILRHKIYDYLRKTCRERVSLGEDSKARHGCAAFEESLLWIHQVAAESMLPGRRMELAEFREHLEKALGELPPRIAQVFQLYVVEERPSGEVCDRLAISKNNLWVMLHRGRRLLRDKLDAWWQACKPRSQPTKASVKNQTTHQ